PSWLFSHFSSVQTPGRSPSSTIGEKKRMAVRKCVNAIRIWCSASGSPRHVPSCCASTASKWRRAMVPDAVSQAMPGLRRPGRALRRTAGLGRAVAVELLVGRAILARANQTALTSLCDRVPAALESLLLCPGRIDARPTDMADIIVLLQRGNL